MFYPAGRRWLGTFFASPRLLTDTVGLCNPKWTEVRFTASGSYVDIENLGIISSNASLTSTAKIPRVPRRERLPVLCRSSSYQDIRLAARLDPAVRFCTVNPTPMFWFPSVPTPRMQMMGSVMSPGGGPKMSGAHRLSTSCQGLTGPVYPSLPSRSLTLLGPYTTCADLFRRSFLPQLVRNGLISLQDSPIPNDGLVDSGM